MISTDDRIGEHEAVGIALTSTLPTDHFKRSQDNFWSRKLVDMLGPQQTGEHGVSNGNCGVDILSKLKKYGSNIVDLPFQKGYEERLRSDDTDAPP